MKNRMILVLWRMHQENEFSGEYFQIAFDGITLILQEFGAFMLREFGILKGEIFLVCSVRKMNFPGFSILVAMR